MKKQLARLALLLGFALILVQAATAQAQEGGGTDFPVLVRFKLMQMSDAQVKKIIDKDVLQRDPAGKVLHTLEMLTMTSSPSLLHLGEKWPIMYFDPRAQQFQVQYVDVGAKLDVTLKPSQDGKMHLEVRPETSNVAEIKAHGNLSVYPKTRVLITEQSIPNISFGQPIVIGRYSGPSAQAFLTAEGLDTSNDNLVYIIRMERP